MNIGKIFVDFGIGMVTSVVLDSAVELAVDIWKEAKHGSRIRNQYHCMIGGLTKIDQGDHKLTKIA